LIGTLLAAAGLLSACGGGGGDGGGGGGGDAYSLSNNAVTFTATQGGATPAAQLVTVTVNSGTVFIAPSQSGSGFSHSFAITGPTTGQITITPNAPNSAGTFTGTITVRGCSTISCTGSDVPGSPKTISVTYTVAPIPVLTSIPGTVDFQTSAGVTPAAKTLDLSLSTGSAAWTSQIAYTGGTPGWLGVAPGSSGTLPQTITVSVSSLPAAGLHSATITFTAGAATKVVPVSLTVNDPRVNFVSPYVAATGVGGNVIIRGFGFASAGLQVDFGGTAAASASFVSDTEIHASYPALAAGSYPVNVANGGPALATRAQLVVNAPSLPAASLVRTNNPSGVGNLIYDAERQAVYLMDGDNNRIERYRVSGGMWLADSLVTGASGINPRIALSPDGTELLKTSGGTMSRINPVTFSAMSGIDAMPFLGVGGNLNLIAFGNDGGAIGSSFAPAPASGITLYRYDMLTQRFASVSTQTDMTNRLIVASADGDTLVLPTFEPLIPALAKPVFTYDSSGGSLTQTAVTTTSTGHASLSRDGSRIILTTAESSATQVTTVYNGSLAALGNLPADLRGFVISPDGATAYAYFSGSGTIRKFDLTSPSGGGFTEVGVGTPVDSPGTFFSSMTISPDGGTLFIAGNQRMIVMPAP